MSLPPFLILIAMVILAAGLTVWTAFNLSGGVGTLGFGLFGLAALLAAVLVRWLTRDR